MKSDEKEPCREKSPVRIAKHIRYNIFEAAIPAGLHYMTASMPLSCVREFAHHQTGLLFPKYQMLASAMYYMTSFVRLQVASGHRSIS